MQTPAWGKDGQLASSGGESPLTGALLQDDAATFPLSGDMCCSNQGARSAVWPRKEKRGKEGVDLVSIATITHVYTALHMSLLCYMVWAWILRDMGTRAEAGGGARFTGDGSF